jgi:hypothetical protein
MHAADCLHCRDCSITEHVVGHTVLMSVFGGSNQSEAGTMPHFQRYVLE